MRPYLAIIKDSFREAMSSWVLWIVLAMITAFLLVVAPLGLRQKLTTRFIGPELRDPPAFAALLKATSEKQEPSPGKRIWLLMSEESRENLEKFRQALDTEEAGGAYFRTMETLARELNKNLEREDFYQPDDWKGVRLSEEAQKFVERGRDSLSNDERQRMNRVLIESAFPGQFLPQPENSVVGTYLFWDTPAIPIQQASVRALLEEVILSYFLSIVVGSGGVLVAVLVTANVVPQMFDPGALHLLLSKPVNRSILFLSKFAGGCAFTLLFAGYLLVGLWFILGVRFGIWNAGLLYCIPLFVFLFSIYYTVSALSSVVWRNAIVSVIVTVVFWAFCFGIGVLNVNVFDQGWLRSQRLIKIIPAGETLISMDESGRLYQWSAEEAEWQEIFRGQSRGGGPAPVYIGPLYDASRNQLIGVNAFNAGFMQVPVQVAYGKPSEGWRRTPGPGLPAGVLEMFLEPELEAKGEAARQPGLLVVSTNGILRLTDVKRTILGVDVGLGGGPQFVSVAEDAELFFNTPAAAALNPDNGLLAVYSRGVLRTFARNAEGKYAARQEAKLKLDEDQPAILSFAGSALVLAPEDGNLLLLDSKTLLVEAELRGERGSQPRFLAAAQGGSRFAVVYQNGKLWLLDTSARTLKRAPVWGQGDIYAATFRGPGRILIADRTMRVTEYVVDSFQAQTRYAPAMSVIEKAYRWGLNPVYAVVPRPNEFGYTTQYALTGKESSSFTLSMHAPRVSINPWRPIWNGLAFMAVMLSLACLYIERQEF